VKDSATGTPAPAPYGLPVLDAPVPVSPQAMRLVTTGIRALWQRIVAADPGADSRPLLLSYDVHPTPQGPVLIEVNTNAGGLLTAIQAARHVNACCAEWEQDRLEERLVRLFQRDLLGAGPADTGHVAIVDDRLQSQPLLPEMQAMGELIAPHAAGVIVADAGELSLRDGRLWCRDRRIDRIYWRSTDFLLADPAHADIRRAVEAGAVVLAPSPAAYSAVADKRRFLEWSRDPLLAAEDGAGHAGFRIAQTVPLAARERDAWYADRADWVFKPVSGYASRGVYVGRSISRAKLASLPAADYVAQRYAPHPVVDRDGREWKYDVRFFADRGEVIGAVARVFLGQVVGMKEPGSGFAPIRVADACCLLGALAQAGGDAPRPPPAAPGG
jgi:hypothetical protein